MIPHPALQPPAPARAFPTGGRGTTALAEHVLATGHGTWWTDRAAGGGTHPAIAAFVAAARTAVGATGRASLLIASVS
ncbi:hypothetical protein [Streptomyces sp. NPDC056527]|uniref:hypothetical protein n=1 Tax=Streptomyces sp. NPDC056527 TaxID=3345853 RepID=UPI0036B1CC14